MSFYSKKNPVSVKMGVSKGNRIIPPPPGQLPPRSIAPTQSPPSIIASQTIAPGQLPPDNSYLGKLSTDNCTWTISS